MPAHDIVAALRANMNNRMANHPECVVAVPEIFQLAIDEIERLRSQVEALERRRRGLPDYEKPPLGQPPSWLQEQEKR